MVIVAGAGPGNPEYLTAEVRQAIIQTPKVLAFGRIKESLAQIRQDIDSISRVDEVLEAVQKSSSQDILVLVSGDPCFFGIVDFFKRKGVNIERILPGLSAVQYFAAKLQLPWSEAIVKSFHGRKLELGVLQPGTYFFFTDRENSPRKIAETLAAAGYAGDFYAGYRLSYSDEKIIHIQIGEPLQENDAVAMAAAVLKTTHTEKF